MCELPDYPCDISNFDVNKVENVTLIKEIAITIFSRSSKRKQNYHAQDNYFKINLLLHGTEQQIFNVMIQALKSKMSPKKAAKYF